MLLIDLVRNRALNPLWLSVLELIGKRAASDLEYYDIAAGVFAGVAPAKEVVALPFLWPTIQFAAMAGYATVKDALRGQRLPKSKATFANSVASMFKHLFGHPVATLHWGALCLGRFGTGHTDGDLGSTEQRQRGQMKRLPTSRRA
jgi:hypothetical protein